MIVLSDHFADALMDQPETGMGYQVTDVALKDGQIFKQVMVINCDAIIAVHGRDDIPFVEQDIDRIVVTHDKWAP